MALSSVLICIILKYRANYIVSCSVKPQAWKYKTLQISEKKNVLCLPAPMMSAWYQYLVFVTQYYIFVLSFITSWYVHCIFIVTAFTASSYDKEVQQCYQATEILLTKFLVTMKRIIKLFKLFLQIQPSENCNVIFCSEVLVGAVLKNGMMELMENTHKQFVNIMLAIKEVPCSY